MTYVHRQTAVVHAHSRAGRCVNTYLDEDELSSSGAVGFLKFVILALMAGYIETQDLVFRYVRWQSSGEAHGQGEGHERKPHRVALIQIWVVCTALSVQRLKK